MDELSAPSGPAVARDEQPLRLSMTLPENLAMLGELLRDAHYQVRWPIPVVLPRFAAQQPHPDLILLDVMMPEMDGYQVICWPCATIRPRDIQVVFLTRARRFARRRAARAGASAPPVTFQTDPAVGGALARVRTSYKQTGARSAARPIPFSAEVARRATENDLIGPSAFARWRIWRKSAIRNRQSHSARRVTSDCWRASCNSITRFGIRSAGVTSCLARSAPLHDLWAGGASRCDPASKPGKLVPTDGRSCKPSLPCSGAIAIRQAERDI